jgi:hypothetical protein
MIENGNAPSRDLINTGASKRNSFVQRSQVHATELRRCLVDCDVDALLGLWKMLYPTQTPPETRQDCLIAIHIARTGSARLPFRFRAYSHQWLKDNLPPDLAAKASQLPDELKPRAERMYPRIVEAVGICVAGHGNKKTDYHHHVMKKLGEAVHEFYNFNLFKVMDPERLKERMTEIHDKLRKQK